ncbi:MAG: PAS domain S-box protein [Candidatus Dadabacteria bacterium]
MTTNGNLLLQSIGEAIFMLDKDGYIKYSNTLASTLTGYSPDELFNKPLAIFYNDDGSTSGYELQVTSRQEKLVSEGWKYTKTAKKFWSEMTLSVIRDDQGVVTGYTCILRDITQRKNLELQLRESEQKFRMMVEGITEYSIFMMDPNGYIITWNEGAKYLTGYQQDEILGKHFSVFYTAEDIKIRKHEIEIKAALATGKYEEEGWRVRKNGSLFWANIVLTALFNEENKLIGFSKVTRDLSERKQNEEALRQSEERYRSLVEQVTDYGIFMMDEKGRIVSWNEGARRIKGYSASEIIGKYFTIFYPEEDIVKGKPAYELRVARATGKYEEEGWRLRKDGSRFWANVVITAVYNQQGHHVGFSKVTRDLTERKEAEKALRESFEKYRMIANELKITNTELSLANEELEQFTSIVSHDLQEPVRTIQSFLQLIDIKLGEEQAEDLKVYIGKAINAANRMKILIRNLLNYSQLSRGEINREKINVNETILEALQNVKTSIDISRAEISIDNEVDSIYADHVQLVQVLQNLISNASKFTDSKRPEINIRCVKEDHHVKFSVSDNGIGIPDKDKGKVFEIFRRLHTKKQYSGTGIGLSICKKIVERHNGKIWLDSEVGRGTTFYFTLEQQTKPEMAVDEKV